MRIALCVSSDTVAGFQEARKKKKEEKTDESGKQSGLGLGVQPLDISTGGGSGPQSTISAHIPNGDGPRLGNRPQESKTSA
jgi:hypothetical protein